VDKLSSSLWTSYLSYDVCFVLEDMCVDCACMSKWKQWEMDRVDMSMRTDSKETMINKPPSHLFTDAALPLHCSWVLSDFNILLGSQTSNGRQMLIGNGLYSTLRIRQRSVTDLSSPLLIRHWLVTDFTSPLLIGLTFVTGSFNIRYKEFM
jgi:hypothetical protein